MKNMKKNKKGFTLVELLAVIVILGILLLVAVPGIQAVLRNSRKKTFASNLALMANTIKSNVSVMDSAKDCFVFVNGDATPGNPNYMELDRGSLEGITALYYVDSNKSVHLLYGVDKNNHMSLGAIDAIDYDDANNKTGKGPTGSVHMNDITEGASNVLYDEANITVGIGDSVDPSSPTLNETKLVNAIGATNRCSI